MAFAKANMSVVLENAATPVRPAHKDQVALGATSVATGCAQRPKNAQASPHARITATGVASVLGRLAFVPHHSLGMTAVATSSHALLSAPQTNITAKGLHAHSCRMQHCAPHSTPSSTSTGLFPRLVAIILPQSDAAHRIVLCFVPTLFAPPILSTALLAIVTH